MNLREEMRINANVDSISEMAQQHFDNKVVELIKSGKFREAAQTYIDNHGNSAIPQKAEATTKKLQTGKYVKGLKARPEKVKEISDEEWSKFNTAFSEIQGTQLQTKRGYKKTKGEEDTTTGEVKTSSPSAKATIAKADNLEMKIKKLAQEFEKIKAESKDEKTKEEAGEHIAGLNILFDALQHSRRGKSVLPPQSQEEITKLKQRYEKIGKTYVEKFKPGYDGEKEPDYDEEVVAAAIRRLTDRMAHVRDLEDVDKLWDEWAQRKREMQSMAANKAKDIQNRKDDDEMEENLRLKGRLIAESLGYNGINFWKNYIMSGFVRGFNEDVKFFGVNQTVELYVETYGIDTLPIYEYMISNQKMLNEASKAKGHFLFEESGYNNIINELNLTATSSLIGNSSMIDRTPKLIQFLRGLWDKIKVFGQPIVDKLSQFVTSGVSWAKNIVTKGLSWINGNPIARIAVPVVALAGSVIGGIALLNKLRKKAKKEKLSKEEEEQIADIAKEREQELKKLGVKKI